MVAKSSNVSLIQTEVGELEGSIISSKLRSTPTSKVGIVNSMICLVSVQPPEPNTVSSKSTFPLCLSKSPALYSGNKISSLERNSPSPKVSHL